MTQLAHSPHGHGDHPSPGTEVEKDPVCGMSVDPATAKHRLSHKGHDYVFCCARCREKFQANPGAYLKPAAKQSHTPHAADQSGAADRKAVFTCPMHPEIRQAGPGSCPICGMALEPVEVTAEAAPNHELTDMSRRFWVGLVLALPVFVLEMGGHIPGLGLHDLVPPRISIWIQFVLSTPVVLWAGLAVLPARLGLGGQLAT